MASALAGRSANTCASEEVLVLIIRTYADEGKSGLKIDGREALQRLLHDVQTGHADFNVILVYDVSR